MARPDTKDLLKANPNVSASELARSREYLKAVRSIGGGGREYGLAAPHERRRVSGGKQEKVDSRTVNLSRQDAARKEE